MVTQERLKELFDYQDGNLVWKVARGNVKVGRIAGHLNESIGYFRLTLFKKAYMVHRLIFMYHHGYMPEMLDHIDCNKLNNKIENLRPANRSENMLNLKMRKTNTSGAKNVSWSKDDKRWIVRVRVSGTKKYFGSFEDLELADLVATEARDKYQGQFARHY